MNIKYIIKNYLQLLIGLFVIALGIALSIKANIGTSPISCIPHVISLETHFTVGTITFLFNAFLVLLQVFILKSEFPRIQYFQLIIALVFGVFTDTALWILGFVNPVTYVERWMALVISCFTIALGVVIEINADAVYIAADGLVMAIRHVTNIEFGKIKTCLDVTLVATAFVLSYMFFGKFMGVGLGTIFAAIFVGYIVRFYNILIKFIEKKVKYWD